MCVILYICACVHMCDYHLVWLYIHITDYWFNPPKLFCSHACLCCANSVYKMHKDFWCFSSKCLIIWSLIYLSWWANSIYPIVLNHHLTWKLVLLYSSMMFHIPCDSFSCTFMYCKFPIWNSTFFSQNVEDDLEVLPPGNEGGHKSPDHTDKRKIISHNLLIQISKPTEHKPGDCLSSPFIFV